jgi:hypothetical protein
VHIVLLVLVSLVSRVTGFGLTPGHAEPGADPVQPTDGPTFSLADMGTVTPLAFYGAQGTAELVFPVPRGLAPTALKATVELPVNVRSAVITAMQKDRTISRVPLPAVDQAPVVIPLAGATVEDNAVTVTLRTYLVSTEGYCLDPTNPLRLTNGAVTFSGAEAPPTSVADFLPPILRKLSIVIPPTPATAESDAAVRLAAAVTAQYGQQPMSIAVTAANPAPPAGPFERQVIIRQSPDPGLSLQPVPGALPNLLISGPENDLINQVRLLAAKISRLALTSKAVVGPLKDSPQLPGDVTTLRALGQPVVSAVALAPQVAIGIDQTRMGRPAEDVRVHLIGSYTPAPSSVRARLVAIVGGETIDTWQVDDRAVIDRWIEVPNRLLQRYTTVGISLDVAGNTGRCGEFQPLTLTIDGDSVVESKPAEPPLPAGMQSLPQALMPRIMLGIGSDTFADTVRATALAVAMQRLSALPIYTVVTSAQEALDSKSPAIIVAADGWPYPQVHLPISPDNGEMKLDATTGAGEPATLTLDPQLKYGALQAFFDGNRTVLVATSNGAPGQLDELLRWMSADPRRWSKVDGTAVISAPGAAPVVVGPQPALAAAAEAATGRRAAVLATVAAVLVVAAGASLMVLRRRRHRAGG